MTDYEKHAVINASLGVGSPNYPPGAEFTELDQWVALGWLPWKAVDPGQISWHTGGVYVVGVDMVKGY